MFSKPRRPKGASRHPRESEAAGLAAFASEADAPADPPVATDAVTAREQQRRAGRLFVWIAIVALGGTVAAAGTWQYKKRMPAASAYLSIETSVPGLDVTVADKAVGRTPVGLWLQPGTYAVRVGQGALRRDMNVELAAGASVVRHIDLGGPLGAANGKGQLRIETQPSEMIVAIDGVEQGPSPVIVQDLAAGDHEVVVRGQGRTLRNAIAVRPGESTVMVFAADVKTSPLAPAAGAPAAGGWLSVASAVPVQIRESGRVVGSSELDRLMLPTGDRALEFVNEALGYRSRRTVRIEAGKTASVQLERVNGVLSINALPWAEVWINGERVGQTPIGNLSRPIGTHEVILRHPELGERRERVTITTLQPTRLGVDLRKGKS